jgi:transposase-like protein
MRTSRFTEEQIRYTVQQAEAGLRVPELCRKYEVAPATFYRWRQQYGRCRRASSSGSRSSSAGPGARGCGRSGRS